MPDLEAILIQDQRQRTYFFAAIKASTVACVIG
jgi:hypothetical protein